MEAHAIRTRYSSRLLPEVQVMTDRMIFFLGVFAGSAALFLLAWLPDPKGPIHDDDQLGPGPFDCDGDDL